MINEKVSTKCLSVIMCLQLPAMCGLKHLVRFNYQPRSQNGLNYSVFNNISVFLKASLKMA